jgi:hypothetical protein
MLGLCHAQLHGSSGDFSKLREPIASKTTVVNITAMTVNWSYTVQITEDKFTFFTYRVSIDDKQSKDKQLTAFR